MVRLREDIEQIEKETLAPYACLSKDSQGRRVEEDPDVYRTAFQRDKDRIVHSKAWRRLAEKTQVFLPSDGDHYRTRLTHTNEVSSISRALAQALGLNQDLAECIALSHDLGHTPFGHAGESALNDAMREYGKHFEHNEQSFRVVAQLEQRDPKVSGLNLTQEVLDGLDKHSSIYDQGGAYQPTKTMEAQVVNMADELAYTHHDLDDGLRSRLLSFEALKKIQLFQTAYETIRSQYSDADSDESIKKKVLSEVLHLLITDVLQETQRRIEQLGILTREDIQSCPNAIIGFSSEMEQQVKELRSMLNQTMYMSPHVKAQAEEGQKIIKELFQYYVSHLDQLPIEYRKRCHKENKEEVVRDYIAGMTDRFAITTYQNLFPRRKITNIQLPLLSEQD